MDLLSLVLGVASVLLALAGAGKIAQPRPTAAAVAGLGVGVSDGAVRAFGGFELVIAVAALTSSARLPGLLVGAVYLGFTAFVVIALQRGLASCACMGAASGAPSWPHAALNVALAAGSIAAAAGDARAPRAVIADHPVLLLALGAGVAASVVLLTRDRPAAPIAAGTADGIADVDLRSGRTALVFLSTTCLTCREIWAALGSSRAELPIGVRPVIVTKDDEPATKVQELAPDGVTTIRDSAAWEQFGVSVAPAVVLVDDGEVVTAGLAATWAEVVALSAP